MQIISKPSVTINLQTKEDIELFNRLINLADNRCEWIKEKSDSYCQEYLIDTLREEFDKILGK